MGIRVFVLALAAWALVGLLGSSAPAAPANSAAALRWQSSVETDLRFSEFFDSSHTIAAWFMPQWTLGFRSPILGTTSGTGSAFALGHGSYREGTEGRKLYLELGTQKRTYPAPDLQPGAWHHIAVTRENGRLRTTFRVYLNGTKLCADPKIYKDCDLALAPTAPEGTLQLGRSGTTTHAKVPARNHQFYGFIDDVAVFRDDLAAFTISSLVSKKRLDGSEPRLYSGWTFDSSQPKILARPVKLRGGAERWHVLSQTRDDAIDKRYLPLPKGDFVVQLPFPKGQAWKIIQGYSQAGSHNGGDALSFDAVRWPPGKGTLGQYVYAMAAGTIAFVEDGPNTHLPCEGGDTPGGCNVLMVRHPADFMLSYRHLKPFSVQKLLAKKPKLGTSIVARQPVAQLGLHPNGAHLHFGAATAIQGDPTKVTVPIAFKNYERLDWSTGKWRPVPVGIPEDEEIVRVPK